MHPYPQRQQQAYYPPLQSRGFQPPQQAQPPQPAPYPYQPPPTNYGHQYQNSSHYQPHPQPQAQPPGQYHQRPQDFFSRPPQPHYAPQSQPTPPIAPQAHNQGYYPPARAHTLPAHTSFTSYSQHPVIPPVRSNSRSPEKSGRPLPPHAPGSTHYPNTTPPTRMAGYAAPVQPQNFQQYASQPPHRPSAIPQPSSFSHRPTSQPFPGHMLPANPQPSSFAHRPTSQSFPGGLSFQTQPHTEPQPQPQMSHPSAANIQSVLPRSQRSRDSSPSASPTRTPDSPTKRPLPAPPGAPAASPPATLGRSAVGGSPVQRRALPFSPTQPPNVEAARSIGQKNVKLPQRSSTLPSPLTPKKDNNISPGSRDDTEQRQRRNFAAGVVAADSVEEPLPVGNKTFSLPPGVKSKSSGFTLPQQQPKNKPTQSLAFRLASLSLREEESQNRAPGSSVSLKNAQDFVSANGASSRTRSSRQPAIDLDDAPPTPSIRRTSSDTKSVSRTSPRPPVSVPTINVSDDQDGRNMASGPSIATGVPDITVSSVPSIHISEEPSSIQSQWNDSQVPTINVSEVPALNITEEGKIIVSEATPKITVSEIPDTSSFSSIPDIIIADLEGTLDTSTNAPTKRRGLICFGCEKGILGRIVSAMGGRWHPACFKCTVCGELLEHVSSYEHGGRPYCHLDYHEKFAPQCYHCRTPIIDDRFITLDDPGLGKRTYHEQHFFCAECGDPFLQPTIPGTQKELDENGVVTQDDDVGFTVYQGHPYCEACHVRLRYPKCKRCKRSIRDGMRAIEALGGKWCWECFLCAGCEKPFEDPSFFQRDNKAYCEACFSVIIKGEL